MIIRTLLAFIPQAVAAASSEGVGLQTLFDQRVAPPAPYRFVLERSPVQVAGTLSAEASNASVDISASPEAILKSMGLEVVKQFNTVRRSGTFGGGTGRCDEDDHNTLIYSGIYTPSTRALVRIRPAMPEDNAIELWLPSQPDGDSFCIGLEPNPLKDALVDWSAIKEFKVLSELSERKDGLREGRLGRSSGITITLRVDRDGTVREWFAQDPAGKSTAHYLLFGNAGTLQGRQVPAVVVQLFGLGGDRPRAEVLKFLSLEPAPTVSESDVDTLPVTALTISDHRHTPDPHSAQEFEIAAHPNGLTLPQLLAEVDARSATKNADTAHHDAPAPVNGARGWLFATSTVIAVALVASLIVMVRQRAVQA